MGLLRLFRKFFQTSKLKLGVVIRTNSKLRKAALQNNAYIKTKRY